MVYAIGIDIGTTNSKVALCELPSCRIVHLVKFPSPKAEREGRVDFDVGLLKRLLGDAIRKSVAVAAADPVRLISIASVGESGVLVHPDDSHDDRSIAWFDRRGESYADALYRDGSAARYYGVTGLPAHANYGLFKLLWMREHGSRLQGSSWLALGDFVAWWLSGERGQDESLASRTFALDLVAGEPAAEILDRFGLERGLFPPLVESGVARGPVRDEVAADLGLDRGCAVCVGGHDHMAGSIACGLDPAREMLNSTGTSEGLLTLSPAPALTRASFSRRISNGRYVRDGLFSRYASLPTAGFAQEWTAEILGIDETAFFDAVPREMHQRYIRGAFRCRELLVVPHFRGSGPPRRSVRARGCIYGMRDSTTRDDLIFSVNLGLALELNGLYASMLGDGSRAIVKVIGPAVKSPLWMQLKADALGTEVHACRVREPVARGAVMLAAAKAGYEVAASIDDTTYACDGERRAYLADLFERRYQPLCDALAALEGRGGEETQHGSASVR